MQKSVFTEAYIPSVRRSGPLIILNSFIDPRIVYGFTTAGLRRSMGKRS